VSLSLESMLQLCIILPLIAPLAIVAARRKPDLREGITIGISLLLLYFVINLYQGLKRGEQISVSWWEILPGLEVSFTIEPLGMI